jgi:hypothetical protein
LEVICSSSATAELGNEALTVARVIGGLPVSWYWAGGLWFCCAGVADFAEVCRNLPG